MKTKGSKRDSQNWLRSHIMGCTYRNLNLKNSSRKVGLVLWCLT